MQVQPLLEVFINPCVDHYNCRGLGHPIPLLKTLPLHGPHTSMINWVSWLIYHHFTSHRLHSIQMKLLSIFQITVFPLTFRVCMWHSFSLNSILHYTPPPSLLVYIFSLFLILHVASCRRLSLTSDIIALIIPHLLSLLLHLAHHIVTARLIPCSVLKN